MNNDSDIPFSSEINTLNDNENDEISQIIDEIDFEDILNSTDINNNNFIKEISFSLNDEDSIPSINCISYIYLKRIINDMLPKNCSNKFFTLLIRVIQIICLILILFGSILPNNLLKYHIILCISTLVLFEYLDNKCILSILIKKISNLNKYPHFLPIDNTFSKNIILIFMFFSIFGVIVPDFSLYRLIFKIINNLKKYD